MGNLKFIFTTVSFKFTLNWQS